MWWRWPMSIPSPPSSSSSPIPETPSVIMMGHWGPSISPWERGWGRGWCRGMRAKARALCQVTKAFQHNNSYQSLPEPVGLYGSLYGSSGMCRCLFMWRGFFWRGSGGGGGGGGGGHGYGLLCSSTHSLKAADYYHCAYITDISWSSRARRDLRTQTIAGCG